MTVPALPVSGALSRRLSGHPLVLLLDVDGTLSPIARSPEAATVPEETRRVLTRLANLPEVHIALVSGRAAADAARLVGVDGAWTIGNHGFEIAPPGLPAEPRQDVASFANRIAMAARRLDEVAEAYPGVTVEDKRWTLSVHYRLADRRVVTELTAQTFDVARLAGLRMTTGKEVIELRPPIDVDKGTASREMAERLGAFQADASLLYAGDDRTDEDAFLALRAAREEFVTVRVRENENDAPLPTAAEFEVSDPASLRLLLGVIAEDRAASSRFAG